MNSNWPYYAEKKAGIENKSKLDEARNRFLGIQATCQDLNGIIKFKWVVNLMNLYESAITELNDQYEKVIADQTALLDKFNNNENKLIEEMLQLKKQLNNKKIRRIFYGL